MSRITEHSLIETIRSATACDRSDVALGIGDDAAVFDVPGGYELVAATDTIVSGTHYPAGMNPRAIGHRALAVNLSDLAAMGAMPTWCLMGLSLPEAERNWIDAFAAGFAALAKDYQVALAGGDTVRGPEQVNVTAFGLVPRGTAVTRSGASPGDSIWVSGELGGAAYGLNTLLRDPENSDAMALFATPAPRVRDGLRLRGIVSAMIDVSDGLKADLEKLVVASVAGAVVDIDRLPLHARVEADAGTAEAQRLALVGGDDYELLVTVSKKTRAAFEQCVRAADAPYTCIGEVVETPGVSFRLKGRQIETADAYSHFGREPG